MFFTYLVRVPPFGRVAFAISACVSTWNVCTTNSNLNVLLIDADARALDDDTQLPNDLAAGTCLRLLTLTYMLCCPACAHKHGR